MSEYPLSPITCHVLNTVSGQPAAGIPVTLQMIGGEAYWSNFKQDDFQWTSRTNGNGRVQEWQHSDGDDLPLRKAFETIYQNARDTQARVSWKLTFRNIGEYFNGEGWWEDVDIRFATDLEVAKKEAKRTHWHVPLLLSPFSYTTYRGS